MCGMPEYSKDVVIAILGASIGLAGLLLVVSGFVLSYVASLSTVVSNERKARYERAARLGLIPFLLALADAALSLRWLLHSNPSVYSAVVGGFFLVLALTAAYGVVLLLKYL
jgi:hypothetical protein